MAGYYAQALIRAALGKRTEEIDRIVSRFFDMLRARSELFLLPAIVEEVKKNTGRNAMGAEVRVVSQEDITNLSADIEAAFLALGAAEEKRCITIDPTLIRGFVAQAHGTQIDSSIKKNLLSMYRVLLRLY